MSTHEPGNEPERPEVPDADETQRLDSVTVPEPTTAPLATDAGAGVASLWDLGAPDDSAPSGVPDPSRVAPAVAAEPSASPEPRKNRRRAVRVGTAVWGLVVAACGVLALAAAGGASIDGGSVAIAILGGAGVALVLGSIVTGVRQRDRG